MLTSAPTAAAPAAPRPFAARQVRVLALLGFSSGVPLLLTGGTLSAWMKAEGVDLKTIGAFSLIALAYTFKFAWAPLLDRYRLPFLGRRRGWLLVLQLALVAAIAAMGATEPAAHPARLATLAALVAVLSASQDIVVDAFTADSLGPAERAAGSALAVGGYRAAMLATGAGTLALAGDLPWRWIYALCAALMLVGVAGTLLADEPAVPARPPTSVAAAVWRPVWRLLARPRSLVLLGFVATFRLGDYLMPHFMPVFLADVGFTYKEIATHYQLLGFAGTLAGGVLAGWLVPRIGLRRALFGFGAAGALTNLAWVALAASGPSWAALGAAVVVDNLASSLATTSFVAYLLSRCEPDVSATQYALLTSLASVGSRLLGFAAADVALAAGWSALWLVSVATVVPALVLLRWLPMDERRAPPP